MQNDPTPETLSAFIDGELPPEEMERLAVLLAQRPDLDAWVQRHDTLRAGMRNAFHEPIGLPAHLAEVARTAPISWRWRLRWLAAPCFWVPMGAALAMGLVIGIALHPREDFANRGGQVVAQGELASALNEKLASAGYSGSGPRIGISFRSRDGRYCRTFDAGAQSGLACHGDNGWAIALLVERPSPESRGAYRMAGSEMPDAIRAAIRTDIQGAPFDAAAEEAARDRGWK
jgi:hypothetical protein